MAAVPTSSTELLDLITKSGIIDDAGVAALGNLPAEPTQCAAALINKGVITRFQAKLLLNGRYKGFKLGSYFIREQIGQGGMGAVYLAEHDTLKRRVALKVLTLPKDGDKKLSIERFLREARSAAALDHPNIVRLHDVGNNGDTHYIVMEYVEGQTLDQIVTRSGPISTSRAVEYIAQAAAGLQHAYERGFVHRDIKPANLMLTKDGTIKILDMGLARPTDDGADKLTEVMDKGAIVGTADYISPEQAMNGRVDVRSDIYSLGATFFAMVTGQPPFSGNTTQKLLQHQLKDAPSVTVLDKTFPPVLSGVVSKMLAKKPENRYQTPADVIKALAEWMPQEASVRVAAALSSTDLAHSAGMQSTISELASGGTQRLGSSEKLKRVATQGSAKKWFWPALAAGVLILAGGTYAAISMTSEKKSETVAAATITPPEPEQPKPEPPATPKVQVPVSVEPKKEPKKEPAPKAPVSVVPSKDPPPVLYSLDLGDQKPFLDHGRISPMTKKWVSDEKSGEGSLPKSWNMNIFRQDTVAEFSAKLIDGKMAIGCRWVDGQNGVSLSAPKFASPTGKIILSLTYSTDGNKSTPQVRFVQESPSKKSAVTFDSLPATKAGEFKAYTKEYDLNGGSAGFLEFHPNGGGKTFIWISKFTVYQGGNPTDRPSRDVPLYSINFKSMKPASVKFDHAEKTFTLRDINGQTLPTTLHVNQHRPNVSSEYSVADVGDVRALGFRMVEGNFGVQLQSSSGEALTQLARGDSVAIRAVYRFDGTGQGALSVQLNKAPYTRVANAPLTNTGGEWKTAEITFKRPDGDDKHELVINAGNGPNHADGTIWLQSIEIKYTDAK